MVFSCLAALALPAGACRAAAIEARPPVAWDDRRFIGVDEIKPGMTGYGLTVVSGTRLDSFHVEIIAVRRNFFPQSDVILARGSGAGMELAGIVAGMSGSPVYLDGRLAGALAYGWPFMKDPIMGITPIAEMLPLTEVEARPDEPGGNAATARPDRRRLWQELLVTNDLKARELVAGLLGGPELPRGADGARRLATPLWASGLDPRAVLALGDWLAPWGIVPLMAGGAGGDSAGAPGAEALVPGAAVGLQFARGDIALAAIGTVTMREGDRVVAFGHPMFQRGRANYPMATATIETVMPKLDDSFKLGSARRAVGTIDLDLKNGIGGSIGPVPAMIPYRLTLEDDLPRAAKVFNIEIMDDEPLLPILAAISTLNSAMAAGADADVATLELRSTVRLADGRSVAQRHVSSGVTPGLSAALALLRTLTLLTANPHAPVTVAGIDLTMAVRHEIDQATLKEIALATDEIHPGDRVVVRARLDGWRGQTTESDLHLDLPADLEPGTYRLRVCAAGEDRQWDQSRAPGKWDPGNVDDLLGLLASEEPDDVLVLTLVKNEPGITAAGRDLGRLPPSILSALAANGVTGPFALTESRVVARGTKTMDPVVAGCQELTVTVTADPRGAAIGRRPGGGR